MNQQYDTEQELFWAGKFGDDYSVRNAGNKLIESNVALFSKILQHCPDARSLVEFGANTGLNLRAIHRLCPEIELDAIEINEFAVEELNSWGVAKNVYHESILDFQPAERREIALIKGVLIHIHPESLASVYESLYRSSKRYIVVVEYYNPTPVEVTYRGHSGKLFKRDFAGDLLDLYPELRVIDYGFAWRRDPDFPQDDLTWFVLEKAK